MPSVVHPITSVLQSPQAVIEKQQLKVIKHLQPGGSGDVFLAKDLTSNSLLVVKFVPFKKLSTKKKFICEVCTTEFLSECEYIVDTYSHIITDSYGCLIMKAYQGDLLDKLPEIEGEFTCKPIMTQICKAIQYCHDRGIAHMDIKPENVLLDSNGNAFLCDFGHSHNFNAPLVYATGTHLYNAPETYNISLQNFDKAAADIWSLGVLLHILITDHFPFVGDSEDAIIQEARSGRVFLKDLNYFSSESRDLLSIMLAVDPSARPTISEVLKHPWFTK